VRRYRLGIPAAVIAALYAAAVLAAGVHALITEEPWPLRGIVTGELSRHLMPYRWWLELLIVAGGLLQAWAWWQILRGPLRGERPPADRTVRLLRLALYLCVASSLVWHVPLPPVPLIGLPSQVIQLAAVWLFIMALRGTLPRWARVAAVTAGTLSAGIDVFATVSYELGWALALDLPGSGLIHLLWLVPVLAGQARDGRWSRATVRLGVVAAVLTFQSPGVYTFGTFGGGVDPGLVMVMLVGVLSILGTVWTARSAHELGGPAPAPSPAPGRLPRRPWALVAAALPLIPAAVNLARGMPLWLGPRGALDEYVRQFTGEPAVLAWLTADLLVGVGAPALLVALAVVRRSRRLLSATVFTLAALAAVGVVTALTVNPDPDWRLLPELSEHRLGVYPDGLFGGGPRGSLAFGISPLWFSLALGASALILFLVYAPPPSADRRRRLLVALPAVAVVLCFVPVTSHVPGPVTTARDCARQKRWEVPETEPTGERAFLCGMRGHGPFTEDTPNLVVLAHGRRLCDIYTRADPADVARADPALGMPVRDAEYLLKPICPAADRDFRARQAAEEKEFEQSRAEERRKCAAAPRHRPRIRPVKAVRLAEPQWPDVGLDLYDPSRDTDAGDAFDQSLDDGLVGATGRRVTVMPHSDFHVCVTLETYARRPPVEVKGWEHVAEVGYRHGGGPMTFIDPTTGSRLPDLSLNGRAGHYRIRVHHAWFPWKGEKLGTQRLLIMAWPGRGDKKITYRAPRGK
jgi:hypothetical protein